MPDELTTKAQRFLGGQQLSFEEADKVWRQLKTRDDLPLARAVLERLRKDNGKCLRDGLPRDRKKQDRLCQQHALLISKDQELGVTLRHRRALDVLADRFVDLDDPAFTDPETLGIAGGILKRKWEDLGQYDDLKRAAGYYSRGAGPQLGYDAYPHINAAFLHDLLASRGDDPEEHRAEAKALRDRIVEELPVRDDDWWNIATRAEAQFGLCRYPEAAALFEAARKSGVKPELWQLQSTTRQLATLAHLHQERPMKNAEIRAVFEALLPGAADAVRSAFIGKVGLALSGGGFRASFYHLGVLARLAELNVLRHIDVLSCVSGGSIIGACYWLALRRRLMQTKPLDRDDYLDVVRELIAHFEGAVGRNLRGQVQESKATIAFRVLFQKQQGALRPQPVADALQEFFYRPLYSGNSAGNADIFMDELKFNPGDHNPALTGSETFNPAKHNWLRANKVPALIINATTVNTGRGWQFTATWMGESPWAMNEDADAIERLEWSWYDRAAGWNIRLADAVAASAAVPGIFAPLGLPVPAGRAYPGIRVQLVDGGVFDNQGVMALLASNCNVLLVSDAAGQLLLQKEPGAGVAGLGKYAVRAMDILMERIRQATFADLSARQLSGLIRGLMFLHMKAGLDADTIRLPFSQETFEVERSQFSPSGVRKDFQKALAELRTDLDAFTPTEARALMACGYRMACWTFEKQIEHRIPELCDQPVQTQWPFSPMLDEITSPANTTHDRDAFLADLRSGNSVRV